MKKTIYTLILFCFAQFCFAQQDANFTLYNYNMNIINPAYAGSNASKEISLGYRSQWVGINDAPNTQVFSYTSPLNNNLGLGVSIIRDQVFILQETDITLDISYKIKVAEAYDIYFGIKAGGSMINIDFNKAGANGNDPLFSENQNILNSQFGAGIYLRHDDFYLSISTPNFLNGKRYIKQGNAPKAAVDNLHMYYGIGYHFKVSENFKITPAIMYRNTSGAPSSIDINTTLQFKTIVEAGMNYRVDEMYSIFTMFTIIKNVKFGAAYDFTTSRINQINDNGSMEVMIKFLF